MANTDIITPEVETEIQENLEIKFPPLPRTVTEVTSLMRAFERDDVPDTPKLIKVVQSDPVMTAAVLRRVNSAFYGVRRQVNNPEKAIYLLGFDEVCNIVIAAGMYSLRNIVESESQIQIFEKIMQVSVGTACFMQLLTSHLNLHDHGSAFTAGLLHGSGRLVLLYNYPSDYEDLWASHEGFPPGADAEQLLFHTDHTTLGARAAAHWCLPNEVVHVIQNYLLPGRLKDPNLRMLALALSISASATEQLCLRPTAGKLGFGAKTALRVLARSARVSPSDLHDLIAVNRPKVSEYITSMITLSAA